MKPTFYTAKFCIDTLSDSFAGYTDGSTWNGWACPFFTKTVAEQILSASMSNGYSFSYDEQRRGFIVRHRDDLDLTPEVFLAQEIEVNDQKLEVFPIGAYSWSWKSVEG